jgi:hypothetical protein
MECVFFLFPGRVCFDFSIHWIPNRQRTYRAKSFVYFGTSRRDTEFSFWVSILFLNSFLEGRLFVRADDGGASSREPRLCAVEETFVRRRRSSAVQKVRGIAVPIVVCVKNFIPLASGAWHAPAWAKVSVP